MRKCVSCSLLLMALILTISCQKQKTSGFSQSDLLGTWIQVTAGVPEPFSLKEDGTGIYEGFTSNLDIKWNVHKDSLFMDLYRRGRLYKQDNYCIDSINNEVHEGTKFRVLYLSKADRVYHGYLSRSLVDHKEELEFMTDWLKTKWGREWLADRKKKGNQQCSAYANDWLYSEIGEIWLNSEDGKAWLSTPEGQEFMRVEINHYEWAQEIK